MQFPIPLHKRLTCVPPMQLKRIALSRTFGLLRKSILFLMEHCKAVLKPKWSLWVSVKPSNASGVPIPKSYVLSFAPLYVSNYTAQNDLTIPTAPSLPTLVLLSNFFLLSIILSILHINYTGSRIEEELP